MSLNIDVGTRISGIVSSTLSSFLEMSSLNGSVPFCTQRTLKAGFILIACYKCIAFNKTFRLIINERMWMWMGGTFGWLSLSHTRTYVEFKLLCMQKKVTFHGWMMVHLKNILDEQLQNSFAILNGTLFKRSWKDECAFILAEFCRSWICFTNHINWMCR